MKNLEIYENYSGEKIIKMDSTRGAGSITFKIQGSKILDIINQSRVNFPFREGQTYTRSIETWACNNNFNIDGKSPCSPKKVFGIDPKHIPQGHELRRLFPNKFRN